MKKVFDFIENNLDLADASALYLKLDLLVPKLKELLLTQPLSKTELIELLQDQLGDAFESLSPVTQQEIIELLLEALFDDLNQVQAAFEWDQSGFVEDADADVDAEQLDQARESKREFESEEALRDAGNQQRDEQHEEARGEGEAGSENQDDLLRKEFIREDETSQAKEKAEMEQQVAGKQQTNQRGSEPQQAEPDALEKEFDEPLEAAPDQNEEVVALDDLAEADQNEEVAALDDLAEADQNEAVEIEILEDPKQPQKKGEAIKELLEQFKKGGNPDVLGGEVKKANKLDGLLGEANNADKAEQANPKLFLGEDGNGIREAVKKVAKALMEEFDWIFDYPGKNNVDGVDKGAKAAAVDGAVKKAVKIDIVDPLAEGNKAEQPGELDGMGKAISDAKPLPQQVEQAEPSNKIEAELINKVDNDEVLAEGGAVNNELHTNASEENLFVHQVSQKSNDHIIVDDADTSTTAHDTLKIIGEKQDLFTADSQLRTDHFKFEASDQNGLRILHTDDDGNVLDTVSIDHLFDQSNAVKTISFSAEEGGEIEFNLTDAGIISVEQFTSSLQDLTVDSTSTASPV